jgi:hypothetical protein
MRTVRDMVAAGVPILSVRQPWAWAIVNGYKPVENRTWATKHRGLLMIHAGLRLDEAGWCSLAGAGFGVADVLPARDGFRRGGIVGYVEVDGMVTESDSRWFVGGWGWVLKHAGRLPEMARCKGRLGLFRLDVKEVS